MSWALKWALNVLFPRHAKSIKSKKFEHYVWHPAADRHEKFYGRSRLYASAQRRHITGGVLSLFQVFPCHFNRKQRAEVIFRRSRPVSSKSQENGSGKQWSLHAPVNFLTAWTISMKVGTLVHHVPGYKYWLRFFNFCPGTSFWSFKGEKLG